MAQFCSRCGMRVEDGAAVECPSCKAPLAVATASTSAPAAAGAPATCTVCGRAVPEELLVQYQNQRICPDCKPAFFQRLREGMPGAQTTAPGGAPIPFEAAPGIGTFFATLKGLIMAPVRTIAGQRTGEGVEAALAFYLIIQIPVQFLSRIMAWGFQKLMPNQPQPQLPPGAPPGLQRIMDLMYGLQHGSLALHLGIAAGAIIFGTLWLFVFAGLVQMFLRLFGGGSQGYKTTLKALCYAVAPAVFLVVPCCGGCVAAVWLLVLHLILVGAAHRESVGVGAGAVLCAWFVSCLCFGALYMVIGVAFFASLAGQMH